MTHESQHHDALSEHALTEHALPEHTLTEHTAYATERDEEPESPTERATSPGQTGGLPGSNADPRTSRLGDDETAPTTLMGEVADE